MDLIFNSGAKLNPKSVLLRCFLRISQSKLQMRKVSLAHRENYLFRALILVLKT